MPGTGKDDIREDEMSWRPEGWGEPPTPENDSMNFYKQGFEAGAEAMLKALKSEYRALAIDDYGIVTLSNCKPADRDDGTLVFIPDKPVSNKS